MKKVLIIDDHEIIRDALSIALSKYYEVRTAGSGNEGITIASEFRPDVTILDLTLPDAIGLSLIASLKGYGSHIIIFTAVEERTIVKTGYKGAGHYYFKSKENLSNMLNVVNDIIWGEGNTRSYIVKILTDDDVPSLSKREVEILSAMKQGLSSKEIAAKLFISKYTVENHVKSVLHKMNVETTKKLMAKL